MLVCGIDEAGRGAVIGPLVIAGIAIGARRISELSKLGVRDSKALSQERREAIASLLFELAAWHAIVVKPAEVDEAVFAKNLNLLEAEKAARIIKVLRPDIAYIDCPSPNRKAWTAALLRFLPKPPKLIVTHRADARFPVVGAASIIAKVIREDEIAKLKAEIGTDFGSGYPADPRTVQFMQKNWKRWPEIWRKSWQPYRAIAKPKLSDFG